MRFRFSEEAGYLMSQRYYAREALGTKWLLHPANAVRRLPAKPGVESYADEAGTALTLICS